jgi:hypothetical protein
VTARERAVTSLTVAAGVVLGWLGSWLLFAVVLLAIYAGYDAQGSSRVQLVVAGGALLVAPVLSAGALVTGDRSGPGHGLRMGITIGSIVGSGLCAASVLPGM